MSRIGRFFARKLVYVFPSVKKEEKVKSEIEKESVLLDNIILSGDSVKQKVEAVRDSKDRIVTVITECTKIKEKDFDADLSYDDLFLANSMETWDSADCAFMAILVCFMVFSDLILAPAISENGPKWHSKYSKKPPRKEYKKWNQYHKHMQADKMPWKKNPGGDSKQFRANDQKNILKRAYNHRYLFGHDWFKPWEMYKNIDWTKIDVKKVFGSKKIGFFIKQSYHMFFDTCSQKGVPVSGSTYFMKQIDALEDKIKRSNPDSKIKLFEMFFTVHLEDVIISKGMNGAIYCWNRIRYHIDKGVKLDIKSIMEEIVSEVKTLDMPNRTFKEFEMGIYANILLITMQASPISSFRSKINWSSVHSLGNNLLNYARLQYKWSAENRRKILSLVKDISKGELPEEYLSDLLSYCESDSAGAETDFYELCLKILNEGDTKNEN